MSLPFCGRNEQLDALRGAWQEVRSGDGPRAAVILGESGLGKTRLVQEFYAWLVASEQPAGYWPPTLAQDGNNLHINPAESSWDAAAPLPFLWWGIASPARRTTTRSWRARWRATSGLTSYLT